MFYTTDNNEHGLAHDPFKALVSPRPIGWISTTSHDGVDNLAPYSFFQAVSDNPKLVTCSSAGLKDSALNARDTGEFVCNVVGHEQLNAMNLSSAALGSDIDECEAAGLETAPCEVIKAPRVAGAAASLECKVTEVITPKTLGETQSPNVLIFGQVVAIHIDDRFVSNSRFDAAKAGVISRLGYMDYDRVENPFEMLRPTVE